MTSDRSIRQNNDAALGDASAPKQVLLDVRDLQISFGGVEIVHGISFKLHSGEVLGLVGESGSGKSVSALAIMRLLPSNATIKASRLELMGEDLLHAGEARLESLRGNAMAMIFQEPMTALNPVLSVGNQIIETIRRHTRASAREARELALDALNRVGIPAAKQRLNEFPHQLSGGMRQRVMIAMALACRPRVLIADEPTTALDVTIQAQILELLQDLQEEYQMGTIMITHDLGVVSSFTDRVLIMYAGQVVENAVAERVFENPGHPYTEGLLASIPSADADTERLYAIPGTVPPPFDLPPGCLFEPRCSQARAECSLARPDMHPCGEDHLAACIRNTGYAFPVRAT